MRSLFLLQAYWGPDIEDLLKTIFNLTLVNLFLEHLSHNRTGVVFGSAEDMEDNKNDTNYMDSELDNSEPFAPPLHHGASNVHNVADAPPSFVVVCASVKLWC